MFFFLSEDALALIYVATVTPLLAAFVSRFMLAVLVFLVIGILIINNANKYCYFWIFKFLQGRKRHLNRNDDIRFKS